LLKAIPLDRQFEEWSEKEPLDPELRSFFGLADHALKWSDLLDKPRVVILAEAGSGKSEELKDRCGRQVEAGQFAFYATVQDSAHHGLSDALPPRERPRLEEWRRSDRPGWFFIDSVDEAKLDGVRLDRAFRQLATAIHGAEGRAHIIISCRLTDWEFRRDLQRLQEELPIPAKRAPPPPLTPDDLLTRTIRHERPTETADETQGPLVVAMMPLDPRRVRIFADAKGAKNLDDFVAQIEANNLWRFARRPLDLEWMVQFWSTHHRLGSLSEMLETSLKERLREPDLGRARRDALDSDRAFAALERIGAALVMARVRTITIPDTAISLSDESPPLDLADILPDWSPVDRARLLTRPVFDPATFGRARLHNDNEGVVSAYLASRWIERLRGANLSRGAVLELLFGDTYGLKLIKPSMQETAAWLSIMDDAVAREVFRRDPFLLLSAGDPASLPSELRRAVLAHLTEAIAHGTETPILDQDSVMRFARPDIAGTVRDLWVKHHRNAEVRRFLLRIIWLGKMTECTDIAMSAAFTEYGDNHTALFAERALVAVGDHGVKRRYVARLLSRLGIERNAVIWNAVDDLFPAQLSIADFLTILTSVDVTDRDGGVSLEWNGAKLVERVRSRSDLDKLLAGLLDQLGGPPTRVGHISTARERAYFPAIGAAACRILLLSDADDAPMAAINAVLTLAAFRHDRHARKADNDAVSEIHRTAARRRAAFWRASERFARHPFLQGRALEHGWEMGILGWPHGLQLEDTQWLLEDAPSRPLPHERRLAINTALELWQSSGSPAAVYDQIATVASSDSATRETIEAWMRPRIPSAEERESQRELDVVTQNALRQRAEHEESWTKFAADVRANPAQLRHLRPVSSEGVDSRLFHLWQLLQSATAQSSRYAFHSVAPLEPLIGQEAALAVSDGLIRLWRIWEPRLKSAREEDKRNQISSIDCMGIAGVTLEAKRNPHWANQLTSDEALRAAAYATLEINGFPPWILELARARPQEVQEVLTAEIKVELDHPGITPRSGTLDDSNRADPFISQLLAAPLLRELKERSAVPPACLPPIIGIVTRGVAPQDRAEFIELVLSRFRSTTDPETAALYLTGVFALDQRTATDELSTKLSSAPDQEQTQLMQAILPQLFGDHPFRQIDAPITLSLESLERLIIMSFRTVRIEEDRNRPSGVVFSPDGRDNAERARDAAFQLLIDIPGRATFDTLHRFAEMPDFPISPPRLLQLARERAAKDSESAPWRSEDPIAFEKTFETAPSTTKDLQLVALRRFADMQHDLLHGEFAQGQTLSTLTDEREVQVWMADRLRLKQGRSCSVERESHVVDEKEPDIRLRSNLTEASLPIEVKIAEKWTLEQLEGALADQLCGQYLRSNDARHGILLLVHLKPRRRGWPVRGQAVDFDFSQVVARLRARAAQIAGESSNAPQPELAVIDVSGRTKQRLKKAQKPVKRKAAAPKFGKKARKKARKKAVRPKTWKKVAPKRRPKPAEPANKRGRNRLHPSRSGPVSRGGARQR